MNGGSMTAPDDDQLGAVVESFLDRFRRGEQPALTELMARHPELAGQIRELIPALVELEQHVEQPNECKPAPAPPGNLSDTCEEGPRPKRLGDYLIIRRIGGGGMGVVYEAEHESLKNRVALKVVHPRFRADPKYLRRFHAEARLAAGLHHNNIVSVFDYGDHDGVCYYAMQYIKGQPLDHVLAGIRRLRDEGTQADFISDPETLVSIRTASRSARCSPAIEGLLTGRYAAAAPMVEAIRDSEPIEKNQLTPSHQADAIADGTDLAEPDADERPSPDSSSLSALSDLRYFREVARVGVQVADAMEYAHRRGVLHRDIKPSNLLLDALGNVWVTDFGLAKLEEGDDQSRSHELVGTLRYMAPERLRGKSDRCCDIYSLGATLYELLALRPIFAESDQIRLVERIRNDSPVPPRKLERRIPRDLETIVLKALAKDPKDRFGSAGELADELRRFVNGRPIQSRQVSVVERLWRWCKRDPWLAGANIAAALLTIVLAIVSSGAAVVYWKQASALGIERRRSDATALDARWRAVDAYTAQARAGKFSRRPGQRFESIDAVGQAMTLLDGLPKGPESTSRRDALRDLAIACMALPDLKPTGRVIDRPMGLYTTAFDPKMTRYAHIFRDGRVTVRRCSDDLEIAAFKAPIVQNLWFFGFSPDGRYLAVSQTPIGGLAVWDVEQRRTALSVPGGVGNGVRFSPNSRRIVARGDAEVLDFNVPGGQLVRRWPVRMETLAFRPDGAQIALIDSGSKPCMCRILDWDTGAPVRDFVLPAGTNEIAWSPDGATLATCGGTKIHLWDTATGICRGLLEGQNTSDGLAAAFHTAGTLLASNGYEQMLRIWDRILGRPVLEMAGDWRAQVSEDGQIVIEQVDKLITYQIDPALEYRTFAFASREPADYGRPSVRHDGRLLAVGTNQGAALWDVVHGTELAFLPIGYAVHTMFDPSGDLIASGPFGVRRWPIALDAARGRLEIGPSRRLALPAGFCGIATDESGRLVAAAHNDYANVMTPDGTKRFGPLNDCRTVAVSPDGKWLATGTHTTSQGAQVWRIADLAKVAELPIGRGAMVSFSPDGKWLMTSAPCQLWEVGTWRKAKQFGDGRGCFSPDGRLMALQGTSRLIRLVETETGRALARLESPDLCRGWIVFSPDGSRLVVSAYDGRAAHVWDLRTIRRELVAMGLDWDAPPYSDQVPAAVSVPPIKHVDIRDFFLLTTQGAALAVEGRWEQAVVAYDQALALGKSAGADHSLEGAVLNLAVGDGAGYRSICRQMLDIYHGNNDLGWYVYAAHAIVLDTDGPAERLQALRMAERRARESPDVYSEHVMGLALYRNGRFAEAEAREMANIAHNRGWRCEVLDRLVVAMAQQGLGRHGDARRSLEEAEKWIAEHLRDRPGGPDRAVPEGWLWRDAIMMHILLREARGVIRAESPRLPRNVFAPAK
jgi:serine/threonine protein kinase/WD40 repeat protein